MTLNTMDLFYNRMRGLCSVLFLESTLFSYGVAMDVDDGNRSILNMI